LCALGARGGEPDVIYALGLRDARAVAREILDRTLDERQ
jgi:hypothetical protein